MKIVKVGELSLGPDGKFQMNGFQFDNEGVGYPEDGNGQLDMSSVRFQRDMAMTLLHGILSGAITPPGFAKVGGIAAATKRVSRTAPRKTRKAR